MLTAADIQSLLVEMLAAALGREAAEWRDLVGGVEVLPNFINPDSNWRVDPSGTLAERHAIAHAVQVVRRGYPFVAR